MLWTGNSKKTAGMFHIKICGVRTADDIVAVKASEADAIGLNFFPPSIRFVDPDSKTTSDLSRIAKEQGLFRVGVFVNESKERIAEIAKAVDLDAVQLHGDETLDDAQSVKQSVKLPVIRAIKLAVADLTPKMIATATDPWAKAGFHLLLDADAGAAHGGSGKTLAWNAVRSWAEGAIGVNWTLAGGLTPENVAEAITQSGTKSVDTASGAEEPRGTKSAERILAFANESHQAFG
jgi:phosphoribosylanthranilate isomerase